VFAVTSYNADIQRLLASYALSTPQ